MKFSVGYASSGGTFAAGMILPNDPSGLGSDWKLDPTHKNPNGQLFRDGSGRPLEFHKGNPSKTGDQRFNHWHDPSVDGRHRPRMPGEKIPNPIPQPKAPVRFWPMIGTTLRNVGYVGLLLLTLQLKDTPDPK